MYPVGYPNMLSIFYIYTFKGIIREMILFRRELPYFVEAFEGSRFILPNEIWFMIDGVIKWREMMFERKVMILENLLTLDFEETFWIDCTERIFADSERIDHVCYFPPVDDSTKGSIIIRGPFARFSLERLLRLLENHRSRFHL